jgi:hypothetical protein
VAYGVDGSTALTSALIAKPTTDGLWCAIVGMPGFAAEAAAGLGCDLDHLVFVPHPGRDWVNVVAALVDALAVVVVRPSSRVSDAEAARLSARLRQRESVLIACGPWPRTQTRLRISANSWVGLGAGHGRLTARLATIAVSGRGAHRHSHDSTARVWLPDPSGAVRLADGSAHHLPGPTVAADPIHSDEIHEAVG